MDTTFAPDPPPLVDPFGRTIRYLRVSVTDRCNFRCRYCRPPQGIDLDPRHEMLSLEEIFRLLRLFSELGVKRVRLTGGEPLLRRNVVDLVRNVCQLPLMEEVNLSTNAFLLARYAARLKEAGLARVNISLDSLDPAIFAAITHHSGLAEVIAGIDAAVHHGLAPVKVNMVVMGGVNDHEVPAMVRFAMEHGVTLRFIETMPVGTQGGAIFHHFVPADEILARVREGFGGELIPVQGTRGAGPAHYFRIAGSSTEIGIISALSQHFCDNCNRMRLTSRGSLVLCLGREDRMDLKGPMRAGASDDDMKALIQQAVDNKPKGHGFGQSPDGFPSHRMSALGG